VVRTVGVCSFRTESTLSGTGSGICTGTTGDTILAVRAMVPGCTRPASRGIVLTRATRRVALPLETCEWFVGEQAAATAGPSRGGVGIREGNG
jgi:hypothetical protein